MLILRTAVRAAALWAVAHPVKAAQLGIAGAVIATGLWKSKRLDEATLKRALRLLF